MPAESLTTLALCLTLVALAISWWQLWLARKQTHDIRMIASSISTQYVGTFPDNIDSIADLISGTKRSLCIVTDVPSYGHFSNPKGNARYMAALQGFLTPIDGKRCSIISYNAVHRRKYAMEQLPIRSMKEFIGGAAWRNYKKYWPNLEDPKSVEEFHDLLANDHIEFLEKLRRGGADVLESNTEEQHRVFMWVADEEQAIFSFYNFGANSREVSFRTNDPQIIKVLMEIGAGTRTRATAVLRISDKSDTG